jgi:pimeloyl-ACP methyl ester carboxylesterase
MFIFTALAIFIIHWLWTNWLLSVPQPLPQQSTITAGQKNSLDRGEYYEISIPPTGTAKYISADYRLWIPQGINQLRGTIVRQHGCMGESGTELGLIYANDLQWQALAIKYGFAILGSKYPTDYQTVGRYPDDPCNSWGIIDRGSEAALFKALEGFAQTSHHPELTQLPWVLWGHSGGADWVMQMLQKHPERTIAAVMMRGGGVLESPDRPSEFLSSKIDPAVLGVPALLALGEKGSPPAVVAETLDLPKQIFARFRAAGALWALAEEANEGHLSTETRLLAIPYLDSILAARLPSDGTKLRPIDATTGWLANPVDGSIDPVDKYRGNALAASWLPDRVTASKWQNYVTTPSLSKQFGYALCSKKIVGKLLGAPSLAESCYPDKIAPTKQPAAPIDVRARKIGATETLLTWDFVPDLENGLPRFRIYRDRKHIATLQGQERHGMDTPLHPHVVLEFRDRFSERDASQTTTTNAIYTVAAFNELGESSASALPVVSSG